MKKKTILGIAILLIAGIFTTACQVDDKLNNGKTSLEQGGETGNMEDFPSVLEEFVLEEFTEDFFESNTLVLVPFLWPHLLRDNLSFYTVFAENGTLNFLIEIPNPDKGGDRTFDYRIFAVIIPNQVLSKYEMGESIVFKAYEFHDTVDGEMHFTKNSREWLEEVEKNSVKHRVSYTTIRGLKELGVGFRKMLGKLNDDTTISEVFVMTSVESLQEYFYVSAEE